MPPPPPFPPQKLTPSGSSAFSPSSCHPSALSCHSSRLMSPFPKSLSLSRLQKAITRYQGEDDKSYQALVHAVEEILLQDPGLHQNTHTHTHTPDLGLGSCVVIVVFLCVLCRFVCVCLCLSLFLYIIGCVVALLAVHALLFALSHTHL